jgi:hypothetical protein
MSVIANRKKTKIYQSPFRLVMKFPEFLYEILPTVIDSRIKLCKQKLYQQLKTAQCQKLAATVIDIT